MKEREEEITLYTLQNKQGVTKKVKDGFSFTVLFFGFLVPLVKGDVKWTIIMLLGSIITTLMYPIILPTIINFVFAFIYNEVRLDELREKGYKVVK